MREKSGLARPGPEQQHRALPEAEAEEGGDATRWWQS